MTVKRERFTAVFRWHKEKKDIDLNIPFDISANELIFALNEAFKLGMDTSNLSICHLKTENPIALIRGNKKLIDYGLHEGTIINYTL